MGFVLHILNISVNYPAADARMTEEPTRHLACGKLWAGYQ